MHAIIVTGYIGYAVATTRYLTNMWQVNFVCSRIQVFWVVILSNTVVDS